MVSLEPGGRVASHLVKYTHHPDGEAHFSQDAKVRTEVRRRSVRLDEHEGHIFTAVLHGLEAFDRATKKRDEAAVSPGRTVLTIEGADNADASVKLVGRWYHVDAINPADRTLVMGPMVATQDPDGRIRSGALLANPAQDTQYVLLVTGEEIPQLGPQPEMLLFYGGFDSRAVMMDPARDAAFLAFTYPIENADELRTRLGSVDFER